MTALTAELMGAVRGKPRKTAWAERLSVVADRLVALHGRPTLGNYRDPVKEIFYILLSARTTEPLYKSAHRRLFAQFPDVASLAEADVNEVTKCIDRAGLGRKRAAQVVATAKKLVEDFGGKPQSAIRRMSSSECFQYLTSLSGLGPKSSLCVMMYSHDSDVFPVDINVQRIAERMGVIPKGLKHYQAQERLPHFVPAGRGKELHVAMVVHGRKICLPLSPKCSECVIADMCRTGRRRASGNTNGVANRNGT